MKFYLIPYKAGSKGCKALAERLTAKRIKLQGSKYKPRHNKVLINWGNQSTATVNSLSGEFPCLNGSVDFDGQLNINKASDKLKFFESMYSDDPESIPEFTDSLQTATDWITDKNYTVVCRTLLNASCGKGIVIASTVDELVRAPLYVRYIKKQEEYRYHVVAGKVIDVQRKMRVRDVPDDQVNWQVRNHQNGFIFGREGVVQDQRAADIAVKAIALAHIDFGAVDIIYNAKADKFYALEINTAPGLEGTTLENYAQAFLENYGGLI